MLIPFVLCTFNLSAIMYSQSISLWSSFPQVKLHITENALKLIARKALTKNTGARGLRAILENILMDAMYEVCCVVLFWFLSLAIKTRVLVFQLEANVSGFGDLSEQSYSKLVMLDMACLLHDSICYSIISGCINPVLPPSDVAD